MGNIRAAQANDCDAIAALNAVVQAKHAAAAPWLFKPVALSAEDVAGLIARADTVMRAFAEGSQIAGYIYAQVRAFPETPLTRAYRALHIHHVCVDVDARRRGVGRALIDAVRDEARAQGVERLTADVWDFNSEAKALFDRCGLTPYLVRLDQPLVS